MSDEDYSLNLPVRLFIWCNDGFFYDGFNFFYYWFLLDFIGFGIDFGTLDGTGFLADFTPAAALSFLDETALFV